MDDVEERKHCSNGNFLRQWQLSGSSRWEMRCYFIQFVIGHEATVRIGTGLERQRGMFGNKI